jgi:hypothetical protein
VGPARPNLTCGVALAAAGFVLALLATPASAAGKHVVLSPREGQTVSSGPVSVGVRAGNHSVISARLNGRPTGDRFGRARHGIRTVRLSPSHGARFGKNVLRVRVRPRGARHGGELHTVRFRIAADGPLAAAGHDRKITLPGHVVLDGGASLSHLDAGRAGASAAAHRRQHLRYSWRVVRAPKHSRLARKRKRRGHAARAVPLVANAADAGGVDDSDAAVTELMPDQPGTYTAELTVSAPDGQTDTDLVSQTVVSPPYVEIDTMAQFVPVPVLPPASPPTSTAPAPPATTGTDTTTSTTTSPTSTTSTTDQTSTTLTTDQAATDQGTTTTTAAPTASTPGTTDQTLGAGAPPSGGCPLRAMADIDSGAPGVRIGDLFCPGDATKWLQVVVLDRRTLQPRSNTNYDCPAATIAGGAHVGDVGKVSGCVNKVQSDLASLDSSALVIAVSQPPNANPPCASCSEWTTQPSIGAAEALKSIGVTVPNWKNTGSPFLRGRFSAIGVPGYAPAATVNAGTDLADLRFRGGITGHLITDNNLFYTFLPPHTSFNTQDVGSTIGQNVIRVGNRTYTAPTTPAYRQNGQGGFQVVVLDRTSLGLDGSGQSYWFQTGEQNFDSLEPSRLNAMASVLAKANAGDNLVIITSRGNPAIQPAGQPSPENWSFVDDAAKGLVDQIEALGGTRTEAYQALASPQAAKSGSPYTLIGWSGAGVAQGVEAQGPAAVGTAALSTVPISGSFEPGPDYRYEVSDTAPSPLQVNGHGDVVSSDAEQVPAEKLREALEQPSQSWPDHQTPYEPAAISYVEDQVFTNPGHDIRSDYSNTTIQNDEWQRRQAAIKNVPQPIPRRDFQLADLNAAKTELVQEIDWLLRVRNFTTNLAQPLTDSGLTAWAKTNGVAANINGLVEPPAGSPALMVAQRILESAADAGIALAAIPGVGEAVIAGAEVANIAYHTALEVTATLNETTGKEVQPADVPFSVTAGQVLSKIQETMANAQSTITKQFTRAITSDYGRLKLVGQCSVETDKGCTENPDAWQFDDNGQVAAKNDLIVGAQIETYTDLLPARFQLYKLGSSCSGSTDYTCWETDFQGDGFYAQATLGHVCPFKLVPSSAKLIRPFWRDIPNYHNNAGFQGFDKTPTDIWQTYALGSRKGSGTIGSWWAIDHPGDYLNGASGIQGLFAPLSQGGLGANREEFFMRSFSGDHQPILVTSAANGGQQQFPLPESYPLWGGKDVNCIDGVKQSGS